MHEAELRPTIEACQAGDSRAQRFIFERYYRLMFGVCLRYMSDQDSVKDVVQEGFLKVFNNIEGYTFKGSFEGWMRRIMVNTAIDAIRRKNSVGWVLGDEQSFEPVDEDGGWEMEEEEDATFTVHDVLNAMEHLTPMYRAVFNLYVFDNLGHQEISDRLGISVGTSKSNLAKARRNLRTILLTQSEKIRHASEHPFDSKLKQQFEQFQPEVDGDWNAIERRLNDGSAGANRHHAPSLNRWAVATAVAAGGALMWVAKPVFEDMLENHAPTQVEIGLDESAPTFDEVWDEFVSVNAELGNAIVSDDADAVGALTTSDEQETVVLDRVVVDDVAFDAEQAVSDDAVAPTQTREGKVDAPTEEDGMDTKHVSLPVSSWTEERILAELPFDASIRKACEGVEVSFELTGIDRRMNFLWNFGDGHFSKLIRPQAINSTVLVRTTSPVRPSSG